MRPEAKATIEAMSRHAVPLLVFPRDNAGADGWLTGGTGVLVQTPSNRFILTADHFVAATEALRVERAIVTLLAGVHAPPLDISEWKIVDRNKRLDICIIQMPDTFDPCEINKSFYSADFTANHPTIEGDEALIIGFPQEHRSAAGSTINTRMLPIIDFVQSVSELHFVVADPDNQRQILVNPSGLCVPEHMGGASGAPVFKFHLANPCELIGIFTGGGDGLHGAYFCTHVRFLTNDGTIDLLQLPQC